MVIERTSKKAIDEAIQRVEFLLKKFVGHIPKEELKKD
jgi:hypothetical protein